VDLAFRFPRLEPPPPVAAPADSKAAAELKAPAQPAAAASPAVGRVDQRHDVSRGSSGAWPPVSDWQPSGPPPPQPESGPKTLQQICRQLFDLWPRSGPLKLAAEPSRAA